MARDEDAAQAEADPRGARRRRPSARRRGPGQAAGGAGHELAFDLGTLEMPDFSAVVAEQPRHAAYIEHHQVLSADLMQRMDASAFARLDRQAPGTGTSAAGSPAADSVEEAATEVLESAGEDQSSEEARPGGDQSGVQAAAAEPMAVDWHPPRPEIAPAPRVEGRPGEQVRGPEVVRAAPPAPSALAPRESAPPPPTPAAPEASAQAQSAADESLTAVDETGAEVSTQPAAGDAAAGAGDPAEGAEAAVQGAAQAEAQAGEGGAGPPRPRGGGGAPGLGAWRAQVSAATNAIPQPDAGDPAAATAPIAQTGQAAAAAHQAEAAAIPGEGQQQLPPQQGEVPATPPDPGPVPEAGRLVDEAAARTLDPQTPPAFEASPQGFMPVMGQNPITPDQLRRLIDTPPLYVSDPSDPERTRLEEMRLALLEPQLTPEQATGQPTPVGSATPPPAPAIPPETAVDIGRVIANLLADPSGEARQMLGRVRQGYAGGALQQEFPTLGDEDLAPELAVELERQLRGIATEAGVAAEDLETAVANRRSVLEERRRVAEAEVSSTTQLYSEQVQAAGQQEMSTVAGTRRQLDAAADRAEAAAGAADPAAIRTQRDRLLDDVTTRVAAASTQFRQAGERRQTELDQAASGQSAAYRRAAQQDELKIRSDTSSGRASTATEDLVAASRAWSTRKIEESGTAIRGLKTAATTRVEQLQSGLETAADGARERIRAWADEQTGERRSWWDQLMDWIGDWTRQARANAQAWERVRNERAARTIASDLQQVQRLAAAAQSGVDAATATGGRRLSEEQQAIVDSLFGTGADRGDPIAAVAAGTRARILGERRGELTRQLEDRLMRPDVDAVALERVAKGINPAFDAAHIASECHLAMHGGVTGWGTDEAQIFRALAGLSRLEGVAVRRMYAQDYDGASLDADLADELSGDEARRAAAQLEGDQTRATVAELHEAMAGLGTDEATIMAALRNKSPEEREQIERLYREQYGVDLRADLRDEMSGLELDRGLALADGDLARADAIELQDAMAGAGTNEEAIEGVYSRIRDEVRRQADREGWTTAQMEAEIRRRAGQVESTFNTRFGAEYGGGEGSALRRAFGEEMEGPQLELANAVADNDLTRADAARLAVERDSFVTDDEVVNNVLRAQYERALDATRRDEGPRLRAALAEEERRTGPWDPYERRRREREVDRQLEAMAQVQATQNMADLERTYDTQFSRWGTGSMRAMIEFNTSGDERERARDLMAQGGYLSPAQEIDYAVRGAGTDEAAITRALQGRSPAEIEEIRREYRRISGGGDMDARLASELDGRDWLDTRIALRGEPESAEEEMAQMRERVAFERANTSTLFGSGEAARMERRVTRLETAYNQAHDPTVTDPQERIRRLQRFQQAAGHVRVSADEVRHQSEAVADTLATTAGIVAAVVVIVAASIVTGGAAAAGAIPALMATLGSGGVAAAAAAAAVAAPIITRRALLGEADGG
ncbi:MAG TPA: hypothetical protein VFR81_04715, partial [Longimicrobium sp.]|nr:hypothetical protein [Longimicrobium sp.]